MCMCQSKPCVCVGQNHVYASVRACVCVSQNYVYASVKTMCMRQSKPCVCVGQNHVYASVRTMCMRQSEPCVCVSRNHEYALVRTMYIHCTRGIFSRGIHQTRTWCRQLQEDAHKKIGLGYHRGILDCSRRLRRAWRHRIARKVAMPLADSIVRTNTKGANRGCNDHKYTTGNTTVIFTEYKCSWRSSSKGTHNKHILTAQRRLR